MKVPGRQGDFEIKQSEGILSHGNNNWTKQLNKVSWNGYPEKYEFRSWQVIDGKITDFSACQKLDEDELHALYLILKNKYEGKPELKLDLLTD